jgi:hypothetical protein
VVLFVLKHTNSHVDCVTDERVLQKAGPQVSGWADKARTVKREHKKWTAGTIRAVPKSSSDGQDRWIGKTDGCQRATSSERTARIQVVWMEALRSKNV